MIGTLCQTRIAEDACSADNTNSVALRVGGETEAREAASTSGQETPGRATSRLRTGVPPPRVQLGPRPALRAPSPCRCDGSGMRTPAWVVRAGAGTDSPGRARRRAAAAFSAADKVSLAPSGHRSGSRSGRSSPGRAAGGGRGCGRQGCGKRRGMGPERASAGAASSRRPRRSPRPVPPPARLRCGASGPGRAERREIVSTANKKRRHMTRQEEGKRGEGGAERAGETENVGWATPSCGAGPQGGPLARLGSRAPVRHPGTQGSRAGGAWPALSPASGHTGGAAQLATCRRSAFTPAACLTRLESKNKKNYDASEASEGEERRLHFSPTTTAALPRRVQSSSTMYLLPGTKKLIPSLGCLGFGGQEDGRNHQGRGEPQTQRQWVLPSRLG